MTTLELKNVTKEYRIRGEGMFKALDDVSFSINTGQTLALVGQSGSGKSTIAKIITQLEKPTHGKVFIDGREIPRRGRDLRSYRQRVRMIFQDPFASLNPYHTIRHHLERPLVIDKVVPREQIESEILTLLKRVQLDGPAIIDRRPHELSGGQRQRIAIARALASRPEILIADEPVSMLDVSIRLSVLNLLARLQHESDLGVLYITHDLATARHFSDQIMVLNQGKIVEFGDADDVILNPKQEYTRRLRNASPNPEAFFASKESNKSMKREEDVKPRSAGRK